MCNLQPAGQPQVGDEVVTVPAAGLDAVGTLYRFRLTVVKCAQQGEVVFPVNADLEVVLRDRQHVRSRDLLREARQREEEERLRIIAEQERKREEAVQRAIREAEQRRKQLDEAKAAPAPEPEPEPSDEDEASEGEPGVEVVARYKYKAQRDDELSFKKGTVIVLTKRDPKGRWHHGRLKGSTKVLRFPANYIK